MQRLVSDLLIRGTVTSVIETGTWLGDTSGWMARQSTVPVYTCELLTRFTEPARENLPPWAHLFQMSSEQFVHLLHRSVGELPLFFLDAHWCAYWPLRDELNAISDLYGPAIVIVHDCQVPWNPNFEHDSYAGKVLTVTYVARSFLRERRYRVYAPVYDPPGKMAGYIVVFQDVEPQGLCLDSDLYAEVRWKTMIKEEG